MAAQPTTTARVAALGALRRLPLRGGAAGGPLIALIALIVLLSFLSPVFLTERNLTAVLDQVSGLGIVAVGATLVIVIGGIDLSVGSVLALASMVCGYLFARSGLPMGLAIVAALGTGALAGLVNGLLITLGRLPAFVATLAMLSVARGLALLVTNGETIADFPDWFRGLVTDELVGPFSASHLLLLGSLVAGAAYLRFRPGGRALYAIGGNEEVARLSGVNITAARLRVYTVAGLLAGVAGVLLTARLNSASPIAAQGFELDVIAAVVIGGASLSGGRGTMWGTFVGVLIIGVLRNGLTLIDVTAFLQQVVIGVVIAVAVMSDTLGRRRT
jgi:ribose transport system permease protein